MADHERGGGGHGGGSSRWTVSYMDFITLLMVVFVVLYSMAKVDSTKYGQLKASLQASSIGTPNTPLPVGGNPVNTAPNVTGSDPNSVPGSPNPSDPATAVSAVVPVNPPAELPEAEQPAQTAPASSTKPAESTASEAPATTPTKTPTDPLTQVKIGFQNSTAARAGSLTVTLQDRGLIVSILSSVLFPEGKAELKPEAAAVLDEVAGQLKATNESILVEGSPDDAAKDSPWDLASRRSSAVVGYLVNQHGLSASRFAAIGYGKGAGVDGLVNVVVLRRDD